MKVVAVLISVLFAVLVGIYLIIYFKSENINQQLYLKQKLQTIFKLDTKTILVILFPIIFGIISFCIEYFVYKKSMIICFRWQLTIMLMFPIGYIDLKEKIIPNKLLITALVFTLPLLVLQGTFFPDTIFTILSSSIGGALLGGGIFFSTSLIVKNGIGAGDTKMYLVLGLMVGFVPIFNILLYSMIIGAVVGIVLMILKKKNSKDSLALAPFTLLGVILAVLIGV